MMSAYDRGQVGRGRLSADRAVQRPDRHFGSAFATRAVLWLGATGFETPRPGGETETDAWGAKT